MKPNNSCISLRLPSSSSPSPVFVAKVDKNRRKSHEEKIKLSSNCVSLSLRSASPAHSSLTPKPISPRSTSPLSHTTGTDRKSRNTDISTFSTKIDAAIDNTINSNELSNRPSHQRGASMSAVPNTITMANTGGSGSAAAQLDSLSSITHNSNSSNAVAGATVSTNQKPLQKLATPETVISGNLSSNSSINSTSVKLAGIKTAEKPIKRKALSSSRQKKFHRHFQQVAADEEVINYFSCAFVSEILLQGYLYITKNYFAFYSNVFGYVTKLLIPITSVIKISKEKTVKIIPNAIAVASIGERHVFSSFISREAAYQLMVHMWKDLIPFGDIEVTSSSALLRACPPIDTSSSTDNMAVQAKVAEVIASCASSSPIQHTLQVVQHRRNGSSGCDVEISEIEDDSSSAISGNECLGAKRLLLQNASKPILVADVPVVSKLTGRLNQDVIAVESYSEQKPPMLQPIADTPSIHEPERIEAVIAEPTTISFFQYQVPRTIHIAYFGLSLAVILALMASFLIYRIVNVQPNQLSRHFSIDNFNGNIPDNLEVYAEILKWQKDLQSQRVHLTQNVLLNNLQQIAKIRDNLEALSNLIHTSRSRTTENESNISSGVVECDTSAESCSINPGK